MIGVFDSGIGGLTVLKALALAFPEENFLYLGDTARLPYGSKSPQTIRLYSEQIMNFLLQHQVVAIVIACNSASSQVREDSYHSIPVYNVILPGAKAALKLSSSKVIGVLGTRATVQSGSYEKTLKSLDPNCEVFSQSCPLFVPLAEEGWIDDPVTNLIAFRYCQSLIAQQVDTVVLGCTHYPLLKSSLQKVFGSHVALVDSGEALVDILTQDFASGKLKKSSQKQRHIDILVTDFSAHFTHLAGQIMLPLVADSYAVTDLK
ncbi:MAG: glutamate racemase [Proteobacteria bacterium]|jgi:glutamate racemase|nr:glutamate racemase [Pseudomonadota bacterium]